LGGKPPTYAIWLRNHASTNSLLKERLIFSLSAFPTVFDLAEANEGGVKAVAGLILVLESAQTAQYVAWELAGVFPDNYSDLLKERSW
jgi:A/G-specific adenine glycosylase